MTLSFSPRPPIQHFGPSKSPRVLWVSKPKGAK